VDASAAGPDPEAAPAAAPGGFRARVGLVLVLTLAAALRLWRLD